MNIYVSQNKCLCFLKGKIQMIKESHSTKAIVT